MPVLGSSAGLAIGCGINPRYGDVDTYRMAAAVIDEAVRNLMAYAAIPFETAIVNATRTPARLLGLERDLGTLEAGKRADLSVWDAEHAVLATIVGGLPVYGGLNLVNERHSRA